LNVLQAFERELCPLIQPILEAVDEMGISRCVASSSPRDRVIRSLELTDQMKYFTEDSIFTSQQVAKGKPAPDLFLLAAKQMGYGPKDCIVIEDSFVGIEAARSAGMSIIGFLGGSHARYEWYEKKMQEYGIPIAKNCTELLQTLKKLWKESCQSEVQFSECSEGGSLSLPSSFAKS
ncbi:MAG: hypothetical protein JWO53_679, partial [Chlamydiia bacterium]|nr:hypothetical protein [Chlamydiia bacterium]